MKNILTIVIVAALIGGGYYVWQTGVLGENASGPAGPAAGGAPRGGRPGGGGFGGFGGPQQVPLVGIEDVARSRLFDTVEAIGTARANESVTLTAKVTDTVSAVDFDDGDYVEAGAVLVQLTNQEEEALLAEARANLDDAESQLARLENLAAQNLVSDSDLDVARSRTDASRARLDTVLARFLLQVLTGLAVAAVIFTGILAVFADRVRIDPVPLVICFLLAALLGLGVGLVNCTLFAYS